MLVFLGVAVCNRRDMSDDDRQVSSDLAPAARFGSVPDLGCVGWIASPPPGVAQQICAPDAVHRLPHVSEPPDLILHCGGLRTFTSFAWRALIRYPGVS